jgi:uncharacterized protein (UPF0212 family)
MTERAKRAAEELRRRGWQVDDAEGEAEKPCLQCGYEEITIGFRYCPQCGTHIEIGVADSTLDDIEAALVAAEQGPQ